MSQDAASPKKSYKDTLNLPRTEFPIRANHEKNDKLMLERWQQEDLYRTSFQAHHDGDKGRFILHDGPPYANGNIHLGHALNKILKDFVGKSQRMMGKYVPITPGWDCHGLPIELKVSQEQPGLDRVSLKKACRAYAHKWVEVQKEQFKALGVLMDWDRPYLTMDFAYEADVLRALGIFIDKGYISRHNKTVPWCASCQTVLASAEIEYQDRKDPSTYVKFPLPTASVQALAPEVVGSPVSLLVWTTTPWTLPLNRAVLLKPKTDYVVLDVEGEYLIVAQQRADAIAALKGVPKTVVATFNTANLKSQELHAEHPFIPGQLTPLIFDDSVLLEDGTACVHSAPGCGPEDYEIGVRYGLEIFSPITHDGRYTDEIQPADLAGMPVTDGQWWVLRTLNEQGNLFFKENLMHSYPHCWRCHNGLIFRATKQWFCSLTHDGLKERSLQAIEDKLTLIPAKSKNRLLATVSSRFEWCLSRQRSWGVPLPAIIHDKTDMLYTNKAFIDNVAEHVAREGIEWWDTAKIQDLLPADFDYATYPVHELRKEMDIVDVWFESGVSFYAVLVRLQELGFPADLYLEGSDQHRAWFQSSLLASMVVQDEPPMRTIMTHGFTVDQKGRKMSKSLGNVISPDDIIKQLGTDGLRLWVASIDTSNEAVVSEVLLANVKEVFRKIRNTCRFLLSNLYDFDIQTDAVALAELRLIDQYALDQAYQVQQKMLQAYEQMDFTAVYHLLADYVTTDLSAYYLDIIKDCLYVEQSDGHKRRSAQTVCWYILDMLTHMIAPILSLTAEQLSDYYQQDKQCSIHLQTFSMVPEQEKGALYQSINWQVMEQMRSALLKQIEVLRQKGEVKHSLEVKLKVYSEPKTAVHNAWRVLDEQNLQEFLQLFMIVSQVELCANKDGLQSTECEGLYAQAKHVGGVKCPRCWHWSVTDNEDGLCHRCEVLVM